MAAIKLFALINWALTGIYSVFVLYTLLLKANPYNDAGGGEQEIAIKGVGIFSLLILIGLNLLPYLWARIVTSILVLLLLLMIRYIITH